MRAVIEAGMVFHDISVRLVWCCSDNRAAKFFTVHLLFAEHLYMCSRLQCLVGVLVVQHLLSPGYFVLSSTFAAPWRVFFAALLVTFLVVFLTALPVFL